MGAKKGILVDGADVLDRSSTDRVKDREKAWSFP